MAATYIDSYYARTAKAGGIRPPLDGVIEAEVCLVGGGLAGLSTALGLADSRVILGHKYAIIWLRSMIIG